MTTRTSESGRITTHIYIRGDFKALGIEHAVVHRHRQTAQLHDGTIFAVQVDIPEYETRVHPAWHPIIIVTGGDVTTLRDAEVLRVVAKMLTRAARWIDNETASQVMALQERITELELRAQHAIALASEVITVTPADSPAYTTLHYLVEGGFTND